MAYKYHAICISNVDIVVNMMAKSCGSWAMDSSKEKYKKKKKTLQQANTHVWRHTKCRIALWWPLLE
jgi:hypothetical protein